MILVVGATGRLGGAVTRLLRQQGRAVRALVRRPAAADLMRAQGIEPVRGDLAEPASLPPALRGVDRVVAAAHSVLGRGRNTMERVDRDGHLALVDAAREAGVRHFVYTSSIGAAPDSPLDFLRVKAEVEAHLRASGVGFTILRPAAFIEMHAHELLGKRFLERGRAMVIGHGTTPRSFMAVDDVASVVVRALDDPALAGRTAEIGGPENLSDLDVVAVYARVAGRAPSVRRVPRAAARAAAVVLRPLHPGVSRVIRWALLHDTGAIDGRLDPARMLTEYGVTPIGLEEWLRARLNAPGADAAPR